MNEKTQIRFKDPFYNSEKDLRVFILESDLIFVFLAFVSSLLTLNFIVLGSFLSMSLFIVFLSVFSILLPGITLIILRIRFSEKTNKMAELERAPKWYYILYFSFYISMFFNLIIAFWKA